MNKSNITEQLAEFVEKTSISHIPEQVVQKAQGLMTDFLGVTVAGALEPPSQIIQSFVREQNALGSSTIVGTSLQSQSNWAAFANGIAGHALDFDDTSHRDRTAGNYDGNPCIPLCDGTGGGA